MLETKNLVKKFGSKTAVDNLSFTIEPGRTYLLLGPNGSGKTTWMKIAASLMKPTSGNVYLDGEPVGIESRKKISYMPTESYFYNWMRVADVGAYCSDFFEDFDGTKFKEMLVKLDLAPDARVRDLSSGMNAKLRLAVAMSRYASVYLLDESLNGVDLVARDQVIDTVIASMTPDVSIVLSSHLVEEMESIASTAVFIRDGRLLEIRDTEELRDEAGQSLADRYRLLMR